MGSYNVISNVFIYLRRKYDYECLCMCTHICACMDAYRIHNKSEQDIQSKFKFPFEHKIFGIFYCLGFNANELKFCVPSSLNICPYTLNTHLQSILT